jgi:hypothetical protein
MSKIDKVYRSGKSVYDKTVPAGEKVRRPRGVTVIGVVFILLALVSLLWSLAIFGVGGVTALFGQLFNAENVAASGVSRGWSGLIGILVAVAQAAVGFGLLYMKPWAWYLALAGVAVTTLQALFGLFSGGPFFLLCGLVGLAVPAACLLYLLRPGVRELFGVNLGQ